jgi:hypothetical protein
LIVPFIFFAVSFFQDAYSEGAFPTGGILEVLRALMVLTLYGLPCAYLTELILGVPVWFIFKHYKVRSFMAFAAGGAFLGFVFYAFWEGLPGALTIQSLVQEFNPFTSGPVPDFVIFASVSAILFRAIVFPRPPRGHEAIAARDK